MSQIPFSVDWLKQFSDPYAVLGLSVTADDRRVLKRYRNIAKLLHPDGQANADKETQELASQLFAHLVNPAYQKLKQEKGRSETLAALRFKVRRMSREASLSLQSQPAQKLLKTPIPSVEMVYEQTITELAETQYQPFIQFNQTTLQLEELNLAYLRLKMGEPMIREKRMEIVPAQTAKPIEFTPAPTAEPVVVSYAQRHYVRAQEYAKKANWGLAVQELRDAIQIEPDKSDYHALLAKSYLMQNLPGMAKVHFRQALKFDPKHPMALEYAKKLDIKLDAPTHGGKDTKGGGLFGMFAKKR